MTCHKLSLIILHHPISQLSLGFPGYLSYNWVPLQRSVLLWPILQKKIPAQIQILWMAHFVAVYFPGIRSSQTFAYAMTAQLSWYVQTFVVITSLQFDMQLIGFSMKSDWLSGKSLAKWVLGFSVCHLNSLKREAATYIIDRYSQMQYGIWFWINQWNMIPYQCNDNIQNNVIVITTKDTFAYIVSNDSSIIQVEHLQLEMSLCCCARN